MITLLRYFQRTGLYTMLEMLSGKRNWFNTQRRSPVTRKCIKICSYNLIIYVFDKVEKYIHYNLLHKFEVWIHFVKIYRIENMINEYD